MTRISCVLAAGFLLLAAAGCATSGNGSGQKQEAETELARASRLIHEKQADQALKELRKIIAREPQSTDAMRLFVEAGFRSGQISTVIGELSKELQLSPGSPNLHYGLGIALYAQSAAQETQALEHLKEAIAAAPQVAEYHFRAGLIHLDAERFDEALTALRKAAELDPNASRHHISLAQAQARTGDRKGALDSLRAVLNLSPRPTDIKVAADVIARLNLPFREVPKVVSEEFERGLNYMQADAPQQAMVTFQEILQKFPDLASVHAALGLCFQRIDDASRAIEEFRYAIELTPSDPLNHLYLADIYFAKERFDRAAESYRKVLDLDPLNAHAYERLGAMALQLSDFAQAESYYRHLVTLSPQDDGARLAYGAALTGADMLDEAEAVYQGLLRKNPKNIEVLMRMGMLHMERRKREETNPEKAREWGGKAAGFFEKVLDLQPQNVFAARMLQTLSKER